MTGSNSEAFIDGIIPCQLRHPEAGMNADEGIKPSATIGNGFGTNQPDRPDEFLEVSEFSLV